MKTSSRSLKKTHQTIKRLNYPQSMLHVQKIITPFPMLLYGALLAACSNQLNTAGFESIARQQLKDPDSALFRDEMLHGNASDPISMWSMCAELNARNSLGGYVGFRRVIVAGSGVMFTEPQGSIGPLRERFESEWTQYCVDSPQIRASH